MSHNEKVDKIKEACKKTLSDPNILNEKKVIFSEKCGLMFDWDDLDEYEIMSDDSVRILIHESRSGFHISISNNVSANIAELVIKNIKEYFIHAKFMTQLVYDNKVIHIVMIL